MIYFIWHKAYKRTLSLENPMMCEAHLGVSKAMLLK